MESRQVGCLLIIVVVTLLLQVRGLGAQELRRFTDVPNVCPACEADRYDRIRLKNGNEVRAWVVADNSIFYVLERLGEVRAVARKLVDTIELSRLRGESERAELRKEHRDQILFKEGHILSGKIQELRKDTGMYKLRSAAGIEHLAYQSVIWMVLEDGKLTFGAP